MFRLNISDLVFQISDIVQNQVVKKQTVKPGINCLDAVPYSLIKDEALVEKKNHL